MTGALILGAVGAGVSTVGAIMQGQAAKDAANYNAQVAERNANAAREDAKAELAMRREAQARAMAQKQAQYAANGVLGAGSPLEVMTEQAKQYEIENQNISYNAQTHEQSYLAQAKQYRRQAKNQSWMTPLNAAGTLLGGASQVANLYTRSL